MASASFHKLEKWIMVLVVIFVCLMQCEVHAMERALGDVSKLVLNVSADFSIRPGATNSINIDAEPHVIKALQITERSGALHITSSGYRTPKPVHITLQLKKIEYLQQDGGGTIRISPRSERSFQVLANGSGDLNISKLSVDIFRITLAGSSNIQISGQTKSAELKLDGSGEIDAQHFKADVAQVRLNGAGAIRVHATGALDAQNDGAGTIYYTGRPKKVNKNGSENIEPF